MEQVKNWSEFFHGNLIEFGSESTWSWHFLPGEAFNNNYHSLFVLASFKILTLQSLILVDDRLVEIFLFFFCNIQLFRVYISDKKKEGEDVN